MIKIHLVQMLEVVLRDAAVFSPSCVALDQNPKGSTNDSLLRKAQSGGWALKGGGMVRPAQAL